MYGKITARLIFACILLSLSACAALAAQPAGEMPILVVTDKYYADNKFGNYLAEILQGEGIAEFEQTQRNTLYTMPGALLQSYETVFLAEMDLSAADEQLLRGYVQNGGNLVAMRPDADLADLFGVTIQGNRSEQLLQYFGVAENLPAARGFPAGMGIVRDSLQYHGEATNYALAGAQTLVSLYDNAQTPSSNPAVTMNRSGQGTAVAFAFDLAKSIALTRQGNPEWQNTEGDNLGGYRPMDTFARTDGRKYYDLDRLPVPQADEAQRLLANITMKLSDQPLPRMWYLPGTHKSLIVNTGDAEDWGGTLLDPALNEVARYGGYFTYYLREAGINSTTVAQEAAWRAAGHETGVHMWANGTEGAGAEAYMNTIYGSIVDQLESKFGHVSRTARNHTIDWTGWVYMAAIEAAHGTRMDMNYYHYLSPDAGSPLDSYGYLTGSGLPQRFIDASGQILTIYQAETEWPDEWFADKGMTVEETVGIITGMFEAAEENGFYSAFVNNIHPGRYAGIPGVDEITPLWPAIVWEYCQAHDIPSWSGEMLLDFVEARNASEFENMDWAIDENTDVGSLNFDFTTPVGGQDLTLMVPVHCENRNLMQLLADGTPVVPTVEEIKGIEYAMFTTQETGLHILAIYTPSLPGDSNGDGHVDDTDASILALNWQSADATWIMGDFNNDGFVNDADATILAANWHHGVGLDNMVPEPGAAVLLLGLFCAVGMWTGRNAFRPRSSHI